MLIPSILDPHGVLGTYMLAKGLRHAAENAVGFHQRKVVCDGNDRWVTAMPTIQVVINWQVRYIAYDQCSPEIFRVGQVVEVQASWLQASVRASGLCICSRRGSPPGQGVCHSM